MTRGWLSLIAGLACAAGCGGSPEAERDRWREAADAACDRAERAIRAEGAPRDQRDLERVMVAVREHVQAAADEIRDLEVPEDGRQQVSAVVKDLARAERTVVEVERAATDHEQLIAIADETRLEAIDYKDHAEQAGLRRCAREEQGIAAADAILMPGYAAELAVVIGALRDGLAMAERRGDPSGTKTQRARYWTPIAATADSLFVPASEPETLRDPSAEFTTALQELASSAGALPSYYSPEVRRFSAADVRHTERRARRALADVRRSGLALLEATGPAGERFLEALGGAQANGARGSAG